MKIIKNYRNIDESDRGSIIAIGNFDGIHNGHKALINNIIEPVSYTHLTLPTKA